MVKVLVVEDELSLAQVILRELESAGYEVFHASDGQAGLEMHHTLRPHVVILDWMLPKRDGLDVLRQIRQQAATPVLMLTARTEEIDRVVGLEVGADDYLTKPFSMRELLARVHALLRRVELIQQTIQADFHPAPVALTCGALVLEPEAHSAALDGVLIDLSPIEFDLLHLLLRNRGRAFSRAYLLDTVWKESYITGDRSVDNAVLRLRKKLGPLGDAIETVWGVGYRWRID
jgi:DNA-binding response OmpR family regulator